MDQCTNDYNGGRRSRRSLFFSSSSSAKRSALVFLLLMSYFICDQRRSFMADTTVASDRAAKSPSPSTAGSVDRTDRVLFSLCNREVRTGKLPPASIPNIERLYGAHNPNSGDMRNAIVLEPDGLFFGDTANQMGEIFRAFEMARDGGGPLVVHPTGFPYEMTLRLLFLGMEDRDALEERLGLTFYDRIPLDLDELKKLKTVSMKEAYYYISENADYNVTHTIEHRHYVLRELYGMMAREMELNPDSPEVDAMCSSVYALFGRDGRGNSRQELQKLGIEKEITRQYTVIHSRMMNQIGEMLFEGAHKKFGVDRRAGIDLPPDLISSVIRPLGMGNSSVVMITDRRWKKPIERLEADPDVGPNFHVVPGQVSTKASDIMLAILSDVFIGR